MTLFLQSMARSFSNANLFSAALFDGFSASFARRGYAAASQGVASSSAKTGATRSAVMSKKTGEETARSSGESVSWVPDPKTGYYRPENRAEEIDVAELRAMLLKNKN